MTRLCLSIGRKEDLGSPAIESADLLEIRYDLLGGMPDSLPEIPFVVTLGDLKGESRESAVIEARQRGALLIDIGEEHVPGIDTEHTIMSHHDWEFTPDGEGICKIFASLEGSMRKAAFMVNSFTDLVSIMDASHMINGRRVLIGMGELGAVTRIRSDLLANEFTFAHGGSATASGQLHIDDMRELGDDAMILGITGRPLGHSLSPELHRAALKAVGIKGKYLRFDVPRLDDLAPFIKSYDIRGLNVTIPYKVEALAHMDSLDSSASAVGALNTICNEGGRLVGYNTDVLGVKESLLQSGYVFEGGRALVIGAGGAAMACCQALMSEGSRVTVTARSEDKAKILSNRFGTEFMKHVDDLQKFDLIVNCTPLGMEGFPADSPIDTSTLNNTHTVFDMVYRPRETPFIAEAASRGSLTIEGIEMLIHQARASFRIWTGHEVEADVMREVIV